MAKSKSGKPPLAPTATLQPIDYSEAVKLAKEYLIDQRYDEAGRDLYSGAGHSEAIVERIAPLFSGPKMLGNLDGTQIQVVDLSLSFDLLDPLHFDTCCEVLAGKIEAGEPIPPMFRAFAAKIMRGKAKLPRRKTGRQKTGILHSRIAHAIKMLVERGLIATRNDESSTKKSACDAVAKALRELKLKPKKFKSVKRVWLNERALASVAQELNLFPRHD